MEVKPLVVTDKNALVELFNVKCVENCYLCDHRNLETGFCKLVNDAPTIEVVPKDFFERFADIQAKEIVRLSVELAAAKRVIQRFSYCNERKCRWCRFGVIETDNEWGCSHPKKEKFYGADRCTCFEYKFWEVNAK